MQTPPQCTYPRNKMASVARIRHYLCSNYDIFPRTQPSAIIGTACYIFAIHPEIGIASKRRVARFADCALMPRCYRAARSTTYGHSWVLSTPEVAMENCSRHSPKRGTTCLLQ